MVKTTAVSKIADSIFNAKIRYGLPLMGKIRWNADDPKPALLKNLQKTQNKMLRSITGTKLLDKISTKTMLCDLKMLSVNQINAQAKLTEAWKINHVENYHTKWEKRQPTENGRTTRSITNEKIIEIGNSNLSYSTCKSDSIRAWNKAPDSIKNASTIYQAKSEIKKFITNLPI